MELNMVNWTDPVIHWNQLGSSQIKRLIDTWGFPEADIAKYDASGGKVAPKASKAARAAKVEVVVPTKVAKATPAKKAVTKQAAKVATTVTRQKHVGADGEIKFVEHRNLYVGFMGGKVVVTKRTEAQCREVLKASYGID